MSQLGYIVSWRQLWAREWEPMPKRKEKHLKKKKKGFKKVVFHFHVWWIVYRASYATVSALCINTFYALSVGGTGRRYFLKEREPIYFVFGLECCQFPIFRGSGGFCERGLMTFKKGGFPPHPRGWRISAKLLRGLADASGNCFGSDTQGGVKVDFCAWQSTSQEDSDADGVDN